MKVFSSLLFAGLAISILFPSDAHAYLDPGTGSALLQGLVAVLAGGIVVGKIYWHRLLQFFGIKKKGENSNLSNETANNNDK